MRLTKNKDGYYRTSIIVNGKKYSITAKTQKKIDEKIKNIQEEARLGIGSSDVLASVFADNWLKSLEMVNTPNTIQMYEYSLNKMTDKYGSYCLKNITTSMLQQVINEYQEKTRTCQIFKRTMVRLFDAAIEDGIVAKNPAKLLIIPKYEAKEKRILTDQEKEAIKKAPFTDEERLLVNILYYSGLRIGEVLALTWDDIDLQNGFISVSKSIAYKVNDWYIKQPKTKKSIRTVPIPNDLMIQLKEHYSKGYIFNREGHPLTKSSYTKLWRQIRIKMDSDISAHIFRHNYCSILHKNNVGIKEAQLLMGHSSYQVTADIYTHLGSDKNEILNAVVNSVNF